MSISSRLRLQGRRIISSAAALSSRGAAAQEPTGRGGDAPHAALVAGALLCSLLVLDSAGCEEEESGGPERAPGLRPGMRVYTRAEVAKHNSLYTGVWTTFGNGVYDITKFIENHPGGAEKAQLAAGGQLENYWNLYRQHYNSPTPKLLLGQMCIGELDPTDVAHNDKHIDSSDPYSGDPKISPVLRCIQEKPANAEPPGPLLGHSWLTPSSVFFVRNHHPVPVVTQPDSQYNVDFVIGKDEVVTLTLEEIKNLFKKHEVIATLQCGGNRREEMSDLENTAGTPWRIGAISNARWEGAMLSDVLRYLGLRNAKIRDKESEYDDGECGQDDYDRAGLGHVQFTGIDSMSASIPTLKAMKREGDVLLAYQMNGEDIPGFHGYPLRVIIPGHAGVRSVKHLKEVRVTTEEVYGPWQRGMAYKGFNPSLRSTVGIDTSKIPSLQEQPVQSAIMTPTPGSKVTVGESVSISGYAYSGGGRGIVRVDVSIDGGKTWTSADLTQGADQSLHRAWGWTFWECDVDIPQAAVRGTYSVGEHCADVEIISKAVDAAHNVQPDTVAGIWNLRGINNNAWHRVTVKAISPQDDL